MQSPVFWGADISVGLSVCTTCRQYRAMSCLHICSQSIICERGVCFYPGMLQATLAASVYPCFENRRCRYFCGFVQHKQMVIHRCMRFPGHLTVSKTERQASRKGFNHHRAVEVIPTRTTTQRQCVSCSMFQSRTGCGGHSDHRFRRAFTGQGWRFNPERAVEVIPTTFYTEKYIIPKVVSIPNGLWRSFQHYLLRHKKGHF